ncbi:hypothetical protein [Mycobacterium riyadhense]
MSAAASTDLFMIVSKAVASLGLLPTLVAMISPSLLVAAWQL